MRGVRVGLAARALLRTPRSVPVLTAAQQVRMQVRALSTSPLRQLASEATAAAASAPPSHDSGPATPRLGTDARSVDVTWASGITSRFHNIWLRDHCRCPECFHPKTKQRLLDTFAIPADIQPESVESTTEGLLVHWQPDGHTSLYPWRWLMDNSYAPPIEPHKPSDKVLWGKGIGSSPPTVRYEEVMASDEGVLKWLTKIHQYGFSFVTGVPATPTDTETLVRRIAFIRETHYGGFWDFTSDLSHGDTAYTDLALQAHTDTTYFTDPAGLQLFHLLSHGPAGKTPPSGGESLLVDGFLAAQVLRDVHPDAYETLSRVRVRTHSAGDDQTLIRPLQDQPILQHDPSGNLILVRYNNDDRSVLRVSEEDVLPFYDALRKWNEMLTSPDGQYWSQLKPGTALIFDNHRVLHGRSAFVGSRRLCGAYVNHDDYRSRLAVLSSQYGDSQRSVRGVWDDGI